MAENVGLGDDPTIPKMMALLINREEKLKDEIIRLKEENAGLRSEKSAIETDNKKLNLIEISDSDSDLEIKSGQTFPSKQMTEESGSVTLKIKQESEVKNYNTQPSSSKHKRKPSSSGLPEKTSKITKVVKDVKRRPNPSRKGKGKAESIRTLRANLPTIKIRSSPSKLVELVKALNPGQRKSVEEIGFGSILDLNIRSLPSRLCYFLVDNFKSESCSLELARGQRLHISESDVQYTLGIPRGSKEVVVKKGDGEVSEIHMAWRKEVGANDTITHEKLFDNMIKQKGDMFKRSFMVLFVTLMIDFGSTSRFPNQSFFSAMEDVDAIKYHNWCGYVVNSLIRSRNNWKPSTFYVGPMTFLLLFYLDRVSIENRIRRRPSLIGWTTELVKAREKKEIERAGAFGEGYVHSSPPPSPPRLVANEEQGPAH